MHILIALKYLFNPNEYKMLSSDFFHIYQNYHVVFPFLLTTLWSILEIGIFIQMIIMF